MTAVVIRGDAAHLPLPDGSVDLIVTSPPYWSLRSYTDGGEHYDGQIGSEPTPTEYIAALLDCTREWARVLKSAGSMFVNLGDKHSTGASGMSALADWSARYAAGGAHTHARSKTRSAAAAGFPPKTLLGLPWRYALGCLDELGLIIRAEIVWSKPNPLPESARDRVRRSHEQIFHLVKSPRYYQATDEIRVPHTGNRHARRSDGQMSPKEAATVEAGHRRGFFPLTTENALGKLLGSVWDIPSQPLVLPEWLDADEHFAAFPMELPRRCILGWSPPGICLTCGEGRRPVVQQHRDTYYGDGLHRPGAQQVRNGAAVSGFRHESKWSNVATLAGYACACTPYTDHPERRIATVTTGRVRHQDTGRREELGLPRHSGDDWPERLPVRQYHLEEWTPAPTRPAVVLDPFGGTGTTALVADVLGRTGVSVDRSAGYCRAAIWRTTDRGERARAMQVPKPPPVPDGQGELDLFGEATA